MKAVIIEDEMEARSGLKKMIQMIKPEVDFVFESGFVKESIEYLSTQKVDIVFLDISLEDGSGFDILNALPNISFKIIFTTAFNRHAIQAFKFSAIDYLLKPIDPSDLKHAIEQATLRIVSEKAYLDQLSALKSNLADKEKKIVLKTTENRYVIPVEDIIRLEADTAYTKFYTTTESIVVSKNLKYYQSLLPDTFLRCHQSHLVNTQHLIRIAKDGILHLTNNHQVPVSVRKRNEIKNYINQI
jgi:two-component system LytT family response regulator